MVIINKDKIEIIEFAGPQNKNEWHRKRGAEACVCWLGEVCGRVPPCHRPTCSRFQLTLHRLSSSSSSSSFSSLFIRLLILCILSFPSSRFCFALVFAHWRATRDWQSNPFVSHLSSWVLLDSAWASFLFEPVSSYFYFFFFFWEKKNSSILLYFILLFVLPGVQSLARRPLSAVPQHRPFVLLLLLLLLPTSLELSPSFAPTLQESSYSR